MSTPREFWLGTKEYFNELERDYLREDNFDVTKGKIPVIEKTPEVVRKLECFDEMTKALNWLMEKMPNYCIDKYDKEAPPIKSVAYWSDLEKLLKKAKGE
jgi:hypothetical protein